MRDCYNRTINYLRISVTDRCNLRCIYCMPEEGVPLLPHDAILSVEEILDFVKIAVSHGITKVRLTGGEPLLRKGLLDLVKGLASIPEIQDLGLTTNGILLSQFAAPLKEAGMHRINVSLDTLDPVRYREITRGGDLHQVLAGIQETHSAGFRPIKLNCVIEKSPNEPDARQVKAWGEERGYPVRFITRMETHNGRFSQVIGGEGGHCQTCNRLRLTSTGMLYPCLFSDTGYSIRQLGADQAIRQALQNKPASGESSHHQFYQIGG
jgi:cyclic pyranopterin phosphate synthase